LGESDALGAPKGEKPPADAIGAALMKPTIEDVPQRWPVLKRVNSSRADDGDGTLIEKIDPNEGAS
jgi:hypothetical protein